MASSLSCLSSTPDTCLIGSSTSPEACLIGSSSPASEVALVLHVVSTVASKVLLEATPEILLLVLIWLSGFAPTVLVVLVLIGPPRRLVTVLVMNRLLCEQQLLRCEYVANFPELLVAMREVAPLLKEAVLVGLKVPAPLSLVLRIELVNLLLRRCLRPLVARVPTHHHLIASHHVLLLLRVLLLLLVILHHPHHLGVHSITKGNG